MMGVSPHNYREQTKILLAKWFIDHGYAVFPISPQSKLPAIKEWQRYSEKGLSDEEKAKYLEMIQNGYNYAIPGGQHNLVVLDFEDKELVKAWIGGALDELCAKTLCVNTPHGGIHIYIVSDDIPDQKFNPIFLQNGKGIADLQSYNSYVVGPGSCVNHKKCENGKCTLKGQDTITCYIPNDVKAIGEVELKGLLRFLEEKGKGLGIGLSKSAKEWLGKAKTGDLESLKEEMAKYDQFKGKTVEAIKEEVCDSIKKDLGTVGDWLEKQRLQITHGVVCEGKTYDEVGVKKDKGEGIDRSITDWAIINVLLSRGVTNVSVLTQLMPKESKIYSKYGEYYLTLTLEKAWEKIKPRLEFQTKAKGKSESEAKKIAKSIITEFILKNYEIRTFYKETGHNQAIAGIFLWNEENGVFEPFDKGLRTLIRVVAESLGIMSLQSMASLGKRDVDDIFDEIKDLTIEPLPPEPLRIAFRNGTLEWDDLGPKWYNTDRTIKEYAFYYLPYDVKIEELERFARKEINAEDVEQLAHSLCPKTLQAFKSWVGEKWITLFEIIGYALYPEIKFRKAFMLVGEGRNGKSTFINLVKELLGDYAKDVSPRELFDSQNRFIVSALYRKLVNAVAESKDFTIDDMDRFKRLTGGDWFTADVKFKDPITFKNTAKLIIASNSMPYLKDRNDKAFWHRWVIVEFPNQFQDDDTWFKRTFTEEEKNGVITVALLAFMRVVQHKAFDHQQDEKEVMDIWLSQTDRVYSFIKAYSEKGIIIVDPRNGNLWVRRSELYELYMNYCIDHGFTAVRRKSFAWKLREYFGVTTEMKNINGERKRAFVGIAVNHLETLSQIMKHQVRIYEIPKFAEYVAKHNGETKTFLEIVNGFGDRDTAERFAAWCEKKGFCFRTNLDTFTLSAS